MAKKRGRQHESTTGSGIKSKECFVKLKRSNISTLQESAKVTKKKITKDGKNQKSPCNENDSTETQLKETDLEISALTPKICRRTMRKTILVSKMNEKNTITDENIKQESMPTFEEAKKNRSKILSSTIKSDETSKKTSLETTVSNENDIYELQLSQPSASEGTEDMTLFEKLEKEGKVRIKHKRNIKNADKVKKKYVNPSRTWYNIEKNLGIKPRQKLIKSKMEKTMCLEVDVNKENVEILNSLNKNNKNDSSRKDDHAGQNISSTTNKSLTREVEDVIEPSIDRSIPLVEKEKNISKSRTQLKDKKQLLEFAKKFVSQSKSSTPITSKQKRAGNASPLSPILPSSPWQQNNTRVSTFLPNDSINDFGNSTIKSSSDAENIPPHKIKRERNETMTSTIRDDKLKMPRSGVLSARQNSIAKRSPLKEINVLEVIHLPPLPLRPRRLDELSSPLNKTQYNAQKMVSTENNKNKSVTTDSTVADCFGFNEIEDIELDEENTTVIPEKRNLKKKLKSLKKLLPPHEQRTRYNRQHKKIPPLFGESTTKQANIREMLSSTVINSSNAAAAAAEKTNDDIDDMNLDESSIVKETTNNDSAATVNLFDDPEVTLDTTKIKRTYSRPRGKAKRYFIFFSDEESDNEAETKTKKKRRKKQDEEQYDEKELDKFAEEFNSMCEEAENYELVTEIESSALNV